MDERTTQERWEKLILHRDLIIQEANLKGADIPLNSSFPEIIAGIARITIGLDAAAVETLLDSILGEVVTGDYTVKGQAIEDAKEAIRQAIIGKEVEVPVGTPLNEYPAKIAEIEQGGSTPLLAGHTLRFIDSYNGDVIATAMVATGGTIGGPTPPTHDRLTFTSWSDAFDNVTDDLDIWAMYETTDGNTHLQLVVGRSGNLDLTPTLTLNKSDTSEMTVDWGDGLTDTSSVSGVISLAHTYAVAGDYWIKIACAGSFIFDRQVFGSGTTHQKALLCALLGNTCSLGSNAFNLANSLAHVILPSNLTVVGETAFRDVWGIRTIALPDSVTSIQNWAFRSCTGLAFVRLSKTLQLLGSSLFDGNYALLSVSNTECLPFLSKNVFQNCYSLSRIKLSSNIKELRYRAFMSCYSLLEIDIPDTVTLIDTTFVSCLSLGTIIVRAVTPPNIVSTYSFLGIPITAKIYVPDGSVSAYKTAPYWITYANYIFPLSQLPT